MTVLDIVRNYLASRSFHACEEWISGCVEFYQAEHQGQRFSNSELLDFVAQQWTLADLREISTGCLPPNLSQVMKITLPGKYSLQVEYVLNIAQPCYSQLQKIRNVSTENIEISEKPMQSWEPKGKRVFQLHLCDGVQEVKGIEYQPMPCLDKPLVPGTKVILVGPVDCRRGVILLQEHNLQVVGGEIDSLLIPNATENVLARRLNLPENPDPYSSPLVSVQSTEPVTEVPLPAPPVAVQASPRMPMETQFPDDEALLGMDDQLSALEQQYQHEVQPSTAAPTRDEDFYPPEPIETSDSNDWFSKEEERYEEEMRDLDIEAFEMEDPFSSSPTFGGVCDQHVPVNQSVIQASKGLSSSKQHIQPRQPLVPPTSRLQQSKPSTSVQKIDQLSSIVRQPNQYRKPLQSDLDQFEACGTKPFEDRMGMDSQEEESLLELCDKAEQSLDKIDISKRKVIPSDNVLPPRSVALTSLKKFAFQERNKSGECSAVAQKNSLVLQKHPFVSQPEDVISLSSSRNQEPARKRVPAVNSERPLTVMTSSPSDTVLPVSPTPPVLTSRKQDKVIVDPFKLSADPFVYLSQLTNCASVCVPTTFIIKGFILTLLSRLSVANSNNWQLKAKVCDGSASLDVDFSSDVLEKLIGFSPTEMMAMKRDIAKNPLLKEKVTKAFQKSQQLLINLNCLMHIRFVPGEEIPCVVKLEDVTSEHEQMLRRRLQDYSDFQTSGT
ncbi:recQ-mediated genome instability protein 1 [Anabrus simplex]|uniref:recQ-mediated genome instability protein 1 n=1 Tax=Anabrus simplex TaxID=316456 RepID=UPI0035A3B99D